MPAEENKATARRFYEELFGQENLGVVDEIVDPDFVLHDTSIPGGGVRGREGLKEFTVMYRSVFPDLEMDVRDQVAEGEKVGTRFVARGTHSGELMGIGPTGNRVEIGAFTLHRFSDGRIAEDWANYDALGMMRQLGVVPSPGQDA